MNENNEFLVSTEWLEKSLNNPDICIVDCDPYDAFGRAHILGAVGIKVHHYIKHPDYSKSPKEYPWVAEPDVAKEIFEDMGIGDTTTVVAYDSNGGLWAARFWWVLNYYGHSDVKVLDGGWKKWFDEQRPISNEHKKNHLAEFTPKANLDLICTLDQGISNVLNKNVTLVDVRSDGEWDGSNSRGNKRVGHVPGAIHVEWTNFLKEDKYQTFKSKDEIQKILDINAITPEQEIVTY